MGKPIRPSRNRKFSAADLARKISREALQETKILVGFAPLNGEEEKFDPEIRNLRGGFLQAVSLALPLSRGVLGTITDRPNIIYKHHYQQSNYVLDRAALRVARLLEDQGFLALPIPASVYTQRAGQKAHLCHRSLAFRAGLGWWGKNNLIVHPEYGSAIRLATVLTNAVFPAPPGNRPGKSGPRAEGCRECHACALACPAQAIGKSRSDFNREACFAQIREFERQVIGVGICGICVAACREARARAGKSQKPRASFRHE